MLFFRLKKKSKRVTIVSFGTEQLTHISYLQSSSEHNYIIFLHPGTGSAGPLAIDLIKFWMAYGVTLSAVPGLDVRCACEGPLGDERRAYLSYRFDDQ